MVRSGDAGQAKHPQRSHKHWTEKDVMMIEGPQNDEEVLVLRFQSQGFQGTLDKLSVNFHDQPLSLDLSFPLEFLESCTADKPLALRVSVTRDSFK